MINNNQYKLSVINDQLMYEIKNQSIYKQSMTYQPIDL